MSFVAEPPTGHRVSQQGVVYIGVVVKNSGPLLDPCYNTAPSI